MSRRNRRVRDAPAIASSLHSTWSEPVGDWLRQVEDWRAFSPAPLGGQPYTPARTLWGPPARFVVGRATTPLAPLKKRFLTPVIAFQAPIRTIVCVRRRIRREVMHALRHAGRRGRSGSKPRRTAYSGISCR